MANRRYQRRVQYNRYNDGRARRESVYAADKSAKKRRRSKKIITVIILFLVALLLIVTAFFMYKKISAKREAEREAERIAESLASLETATEEETTKPPFHAEIDIVSVGDVICHTPILRYCLQDDGTYDFSEMFAQLKDTISKADLAVVNQETPIDPTADPDGGIDYIFNAPTEIGEAEIDAGFDLILQSSNHSYDYRTDGILNTVEFWKSKSDLVTMIGMYDSQEARDTPVVLDVSGIKIGVYNCTYSLNGFYLPYDMQYLTNIIEDSNYDMIVSDIEELESMSDIVIVFPHWGAEDNAIYTTEFQNYWAEVFTGAGADIIIGTHPHVCEKIEWVTSDNGNRCLCYYSVGNFATNQQELAEVLCAMAKIRIVKDEDYTYIDESKTGVVPLVDHNVYVGSYVAGIFGGGWVNNVVVYKLSDYTEEMAEEHDIKNRFDPSFSLEGLKSLAEETFGDWIIDY